MDTLWNVVEKLSNSSSLDEKMHTLRSKIESLRCRADDVTAKLQDEEFRTGKKRKREVENWLDNVQKKKIEFESLEKDVQGNPGYQNQKRAGKMIGEVVELLEQGKFREELLLNVTNAVPLLTTELKGQEFKQNLEKIRNCLMKEDIMYIGIYGMGGSGKTTLATHVHNLLLKSSATSDINVYWITVSQDWSIDKLQNDIANLLKVDLTTENERNRRAAIISQALTRRKKSILILDDVWKHFNLEEIGILCRVNELKLIFTTRLLEVCHKMGCQEIIHVRPLFEDEARNLFLEKLVPEGGEIPWLKNPEIKEIAMSMAKRCCNLPLAIITVAKSMMGLNDIHEWRNALHELEEFITEQGDMEEDVFSKLKFSYMRLKNEKLKDCFLYCALYPEDWRLSRNELIPKFIAEGLIDRKKTREAQFNKGHTMLNELENACLLESCGGYNSPYMKMHDLMREMALKIAGRRLMVKTCYGYEKIPEEHEWTEELKRISLMCTSIKEIPQGMSPRCPELSTLILQCCWSLNCIPCSFFEHMSALHILDLSWTIIVELPSTISDLENLTALFLNGCKELRIVPPLGKLKALQLLDLGGCTSIEEVPQGMEMLVNLKCLYMDGIRCLESFPYGILSKLSSLQDIRTGSMKIRVEELERLGQLEKLEGCLYSMFDFNRFVNSDHYRQLNTCRLLVGEYTQAAYNYEDYNFYKYNYEREYEKEAKFRNCCHGNEGEDKLLLVPRNIQCLRIVDCHNVSGLCDVSHSWNHCAPFQSLEILRLYNLPRLSGLIKWVGVTLPGFLSNLQLLDIILCPKMKKLLTPRLLQNLRNLQTIRVQECEEMEEIIGDEEDELMGTSNNHPTSSSTIFTLPNLRELELSSLPRLSGLIKREGVTPFQSLEILRLHDLPRLSGLTKRVGILSNLQLLYILWCPKMKTLLTPRLLQNLRNLQTIKVIRCEEMEEIIGDDEDKLLGTSNNHPSSSSSTIFTLPNLRKLRLSYLPRLSGLIKRVGVTPPGILSNLQVLKINSCPKIKKLLTPRLLQNLRNLQTIRVWHCDEMEEIIGDDEDELMGTSNNHPSSSSSSSTIFTLPNLRKLFLYDLPELKSVCKGLMVCDSLETIGISKCPELKRFPLSLPLVHGQLSPPAALREILLDSDDEEWWDSLEWDHPNAQDVLQPFVDWWEEY